MFSRKVRVGLIIDKLATEDCVDYDECGDVVTYYDVTDDAVVEMKFADTDWITLKTIQVSVDPDGNEEVMLEFTNDAFIATKRSAYHFIQVSKATSEEEV